MLLASFTYDLAQSNPVGSMKRWDIVGRFAVRGVDNVTLLVRVRTAGVAGEVVAIAAARFVPMGRTANNYVRDCSVHDSYYRCVSIHGSHNVTLSRNVAHNISGHCFYLEDGVEERNTIEFNLAANIHPIFEAATGWGQVGVQYVQSPALLNPADTGAAGYYITNAYNTVVGNAASGGWAGFSFSNLPRPIGPFWAHDFGDFNPWARPVLVFDGNSAHSAGYHAPFRDVSVRGRTPAEQHPHRAAAVQPKARGRYTEPDQRIRCRRAHGPPQPPRGAVQHWHPALGQRRGPGGL